MANPIQNKQIAIVGGGPGGLTLARLLQMKGADVKVYERDANRDVRVQGATLDLHYDSGLKALTAAGLMDAFKANYRPGADKMRVTNKNAEVLFEDNFETGGDNGLARPEIDRGPLRDILLDSLQSGTVVWDSNFVSMTAANDGFSIQFKNNAPVYADIVIGADGANSRVRPYLTPVKAFYAGVTAMEGAVYHSKETVPHIHHLLQGGKIFALGDEKCLFVSSKGDGSLAFYTSCKTPETWLGNSAIDFSDKAQILAWFKQEFSGWDTIWNELFENVTGGLVPRPQYCMPFDQLWEALPNLTLLGDAAHLMPPYAGEGVNMAMLDALELAECLLSSAFADVQSAIAAYEKAMRSRASAVAKMTMEQTAILHSPEGLNHLLAMFKIDEP